MSRNIKVQNIRDFRGGVNLRGDGFELGENESPDILNMDIDPRGGLQSRAGVQLQAMGWGNANRFTANASTYLDTVDNTGMGLSNNTQVRSTAGPLPTVGLYGRAMPGAFRRATISSAAAAYMQGGFSCTPSQRWSMGANFRSVSGSLHQVALRIDWYTASGGGFISSTLGTVTTLTTAWQFLRLEGVTSPTNATWAVPIFWIAYNVPTSGSVVDISGAFFADGYNPYWFDQNDLNLPGEVVSWGRYVRANVDQLFAVAGSTVVYCNANTPGVWFILKGQWSGTGWFVQFKDVVYIGETNQFTSAWDGYTLQAMADGYNDNLALPTSGAFAGAARFPVMGRSSPAVFQGVVFVAVGQDLAGTYYTNRLRWSHPNSANDWRSFDYIDIDIGNDGDSIQALVPFQDKLLIFKRNATYVLTGTSPDTYQVYPLSRRVGAVDQRAVALTESGVYFYDEREGVFVFDGTRLRWLFERIQPLITQDLIARSQVARVRMGWSGRRLWLAVPWRATTADAAPVNNTRVFVLDPQLSKEGSWTQYDLVVGTMIELTVPGQAVRLLGARPYLGRFYTLENPSVVPLAYDTINVNGGLTADAQAHITSYYISPWVDMKQPAIAKRWRRPVFVIRSVNAVSSLAVEVRKDFDPRIPRRLFNLVTKVDAAEMTWGSNWGLIWAGGAAAGVASPASVILSGPTLGKARAVQIKVNGPPANDNFHWGLNAMALKYSPLPPRS